MTCLLYTSCEDLVLRAERQARQISLHSPQGRQQSREDKKKISVQNFKTRRANESPCFRGAQRNRIAIKGDAAHHPARAGIPGVILPKCQESAQLEAIKNGCLLYTSRCV